MRYLHPGLSPKTLQGISSRLPKLFPLQQAGSCPTPCEGSILFGDCMSSTPQAWPGTHLSCINDIPFIFPSRWRGLGAESSAQTVSLALRESWHCDIWEGKHVLPTWGSPGARHGAKPEGCGIIQGTVSKRDSRGIEPGCSHPDKPIKEVLE